ncbi:MAG: hypothetical protein PVI57_06105 [Gemmatimonadota bacterium]|jgi:hypothetical protein
MTALELDRHLLASSATRWDTAWRTYGWTPALEGPRASRLEEAVPWGTRSARLDRPPRLSGSVADVLAPGNLARLGRAYLPMDGRLGFSLWGAVGESRVGSEWRVATHTVLLDEDAFRRLSGHPAGLLAPGGTPAPWLRSLAEGIDLGEPAPLPPIRVDGSPSLREAMARDRLAELRALLRTLRASRSDGGAGLAAELADVYEALAAAVEGTSLKHVAVRVGEDEGGRALLRLVWLSLPLEDRLRVFYVTEQRRAERPPGHLLGLPEDEWGRFVPGDAWILGASEPLGPVSPGRRHWARLLAAGDGLAAFERADGRAEGSGWRIVGADDLRPLAEHARWRREWKTEGPTVGAVEALLRRERGRPGGPRLGAVGDALGRVVAAGAPPAEAVGLLSGLDGDAVEVVVRGAVRVLRGRGRRADAGRVRAAATEAFGGRGTLARGLHRMVDRESDALRALLGAADGPGALVRAAFRPAAAGDPVALEIGRLSVAARPWDGESGAALASALPLDVDGAREAGAELLLALVREGADVRSVEAVAAPLLDRLPPEAVADLAEPLLELAAGPAPGGRVEALRRAAVLRAVEGGGRELDGPVAELIRLGGRTAPPGLAPAPWRALIDAAPAPWLGRAPVLEALAEALDAGRRPLLHPDVTPTLRELASLLARRVLLRAGPGSLDRRQADALLRLVWLEGDGATPTWLVGTRPDAAAALLAQLIVAPAPLELEPMLRDAFVEAVETAPRSDGLEPLAAELRAWAPALHERAGLAGTGERFVPLGRA